MLVNYLKSLVKSLNRNDYSSRKIAVYHSLPTDLGATVHVQCPKCDVDGYWHLFRFMSSFIIFFVPLIPYRKDYFIRCMACSEEIILRQSEISRAIRLSQFVKNYTEKPTISEDINIIELKAWLTKRILVSVGTHIDKSDNAVWGSLNDKFSDAIDLSNYKPQEAIDEMNKLLLEGFNINAKNAEGWTLLRIARYYEVPKSVLGLIKSFGGK